MEFKTVPNLADEQKPTNFISIAKAPANPQQTNALISADGLKHILWAVGESKKKSSWEEFLHV